MSALWVRSPKTKGAQVAKPVAPPPPPGVNVHSIVAGNGQHYIVPPRTGGQPWIGHKGRTPQASGFAPSETFAPHSGGPNMPPSTRLRSSVPAVVNSITGTAAGTWQMSPGGGVNMPSAQKAPGRSGK